MSTPSYKLSKTGSTWWATGELSSGRPFKVDCGSGTKDRAEGVAEIKVKAKLASSKGSKARWEKWHRERAAGKTAASPAPHAAPPPAPAASPAPAAAAAPRASDDELRAKLLHLGDVGKPPEPVEVNVDKVIPPDGKREGAAADDERPAEPEDDPDTDTEGTELIASLLAKGATLGLVGLVNLRLKKKKPPQHAEAHEKGLEYFHDGIEVVATKLVGRTAKLGPTGKIIVGALIIVGSMHINAEPIDGAAAAPAAPPPEPAPTKPSSTSNGHNEAPSTALATQTSPLGVFGVEKRTAN